MDRQSLPALKGKLITVLVHDEFSFIPQRVQFLCNHSFANGTNALNMACNVDSKILSIGHKFGTIRYGGPMHFAEINTYF